MAYDITVSGPGARTLFDLRGTTAGLTCAALPPWPGRPNSRTEQGARSLIWLGPGRWLLMAPPEDEAALEADLPQGGVTLWSDALVFLALTGADAGVAMAIACPLDLHPAAFPQDAAGFTDVFGTRGLVLREGAAWVLGVDPSYADYICDHLRRIV